MPVKKKIFSLIRWPKCQEISVVDKKSCLLVVILLVVLLFVGPFRKEPYEKLLKHLKKPDVIVRLSAMEALTNLGDEVLPYLLSSLRKEENILFKVSAIQVIGDINNVIAVTTLIEYLKYDNWRVRFFSAESLGKLKSSEAVYALKNVIAFDKNKNVRYRALLSLDEIEGFNDIDFLKGLLRENHKFTEVFIREVDKMIAAIEASQMPQQL